MCGVRACFANVDSIGSLLIKKVTGSGDVTGAKDLFYDCFLKRGPYFHRSVSVVVSAHE